jgi:putative transposase
VCEFLKAIRAFNPKGRIVVILDNFRSHHAKLTEACAVECGIALVHLPPYSPDLNPLEFIWKSIKRVISQTFIPDLCYLMWLIREHFEELSSRLSFAQGWIERFLDEDVKYKLFGS